MLDFLGEPTPDWSFTCNMFFSNNIKAVLILARMYD